MSISSRVRFFPSKNHHPKTLDAFAFDGNRFESSLLTEALRETSIFKRRLIYSPNILNLFHVSSAKVSQSNAARMSDYEIEGKKETRRRDADNGSIS